MTTMMQKVMNGEAKMEEMENQPVEQEAQEIDKEAALAEHIVPALKQKHGDIYRIDLNGKTFIFKTISRHEWVEANNAFMHDDKKDLHGEVVERCVLWGEEDVTLKAGTIDQIAARVLELSNFSNDEAAARVIKL